MITLTPAVALPAASLPTRRSRHDDIRSIPSVLRSDWIKLVSVRSTTAILALNAVAGFLMAWAVATFVTGEVLTVSEVGFYSTAITAILAAVGGILLFTSEVQHGTLATVLAAQPARWVIALSKTVTAAAFGLALGATSLIMGFAGAALAGIEMGDTGGIPASVVAALVYTMLGAILGLAVGMLVQHSAVAVSGLLVWGLVIEGLLSFFIPARVSRFLPFLAGDRLLAIDSGPIAPEAISIALSRTEAALVFGGYTALALAVGVVLFSRRDAP